MATELRLSTRRVLHCASGDKYVDSRGLLETIGLHIITEEDGFYVVELPDGLIVQSRQDQGVDDLSIFHVHGHWILQQFNDPPRIYSLMDFPKA